MQLPGITPKGRLLSNFNNGFFFSFNLFLETFVGCVIHCLRGDHWELRVEQGSHEEMHQSRRNKGEGVTQRIVDAKPTMPREWLGLETVSHSRFSKETFKGGQEQQPGLVQTSPWTFQLTSSETCRSY